MRPASEISHMSISTPATEAVTLGSGGTASVNVGGMVASTLFENGVEQVGRILDGLQAWMEEKEYDSVEQLKGSMSRENCPDPAAFQRGNYMKTLTSYVGKAI